MYGFLRFSWLHAVDHVDHAFLMWLRKMADDGSDQERPCLVSGRVLAITVAGGLKAEHPPSLHRI